MRGCPRRRVAEPGHPAIGDPGHASVLGQRVRTGLCRARHHRHGRRPRYLAGQNAAGLPAYATAVSTPSSADYGHYLSAAQVKAEFGPTSAQIAAVKAWLTGDGLTVTSVNNSVDGYVAVSGSVSAAAKAFSVTFQNFKGPDKRTDRAPAEAASAPAWWPVPCSPCPAWTPRPTR